MNTYPQKRPVKKRVTPAQQILSQAVQLAEKIEQSHYRINYLSRVGQLSTVEHNVLESGLRMLSVELLEKGVIRRH